MPVPHIKVRRVLRPQHRSQTACTPLFGEDRGPVLGISLPNSGSLGTMYFEGMLTLGSDREKKSSNGAQRTGAAGLASTLS